MDKPTVCLRCGKAPRRPGRHCCAECAKLTYYGGRRERLIARGKCGICGRPLDIEGKVTCGDCLANRHAKREDSNDSPKPKAPSKYIPMVSAARRFGVDQPLVARLVKDALVPSIKAGRTTLVNSDALFVELGRMRKEGEL